LPLGGPQLGERPVLPAVGVPREPVLDHAVSLRPARVRQTGAMGKREGPQILSRWPAWVYREGQEPDYRFSFANERTFLAWIRTALALLAAGVALDVVDLSIPAWAQHALALVLVGLALVAAAAAWLRWALAERAMRCRRPLPS